MAKLPDDSPALFFTLGPMISRQIAGVHANVEHHRLLALADEFHQFHSHGSKSPIEPDHDKWRMTVFFRSIVSAADFLQLLFIDRKRFFDEHGFVIRERRNYISRMTVMTR